MGHLGENASMLLLQVVSAASSGACLPTISTDTTSCLGAVEHSALKEAYFSRK